MDGAEAGLIVEALRSKIVFVERLVVRPGAATALVGPSGSGKTSLLRAIVDLDPNEGEVSLDGARRSQMSAPAWRRRVAYVPAEPGWWGTRAGDHVGPAEVYALDLAAFDLPPRLLEQPIAELSTGERQRLALALALARRPAALLLDEPTSALDEANRDRVEAVLGRAVAAGTAVLMTTHDPRQIERLGLRTVRIAGGRLEGEAA